MSTTPHTATPVGLVLGSEIPPDRIADIAAQAEAAGLGELWLSEDYFMTGGIAGAGIALSATQHIPVGLGVVSAVARHPALLAMEVATLAHAHPGRLRPAIGLGVPGWLDQMGLRPASALRAVRESLETSRALLRGDTLSTATSTFHFDGVELTYPLGTDTPPFSLGVAGPKMLALSGEIADGTLMSVLAGVDYVRWARERIAEGAQRSARGGSEHRVTVFAIYCADDDAGVARDLLRPTVAFYLAAGGANALTDAYGISDQLMDMIARGGVDTVREEMPDQWVRDLTVSGSPHDCVEAINRLLDAGADSVCLFPVPSERATELIDIAARQILPQLQSST